MTACSSSDTAFSYEDLTEGTGELAEKGDTIEVHYVGTFEDGSQFDSSRDRGQTFSFELGAGQVIEGWEQGFEGMREGGLRNLVIPASMGYGDNDYAGIPGGSTLYFEVELISVQK